MKIKDVAILIANPERPSKTCLNISWLDLTFGMFDA